MSKLSEEEYNHFLKIFDNPRLFIETFFKILDKKGRLVPFYFNNVQEEYYEHLMKNHWKPYKTANGNIKNRFQGIRIDELKSRQYGGSTFIEGIIAFDTLTNEGINSRIYCQDFEYSKQMLEKFKRFYDNMPEFFRPEQGYNTVGYVTYPRLMSSIKAEKPGASESVARKQGRSTTIHNLHISELAEWQNAEVTMLGLMEAVTNDGNVFIESSPKKIGDYFYIIYNQGKNPKSEWFSRFVPWFKIEQYQLNIDDETSNDIQNTLIDKEIELIDKHGLSLNQIAWRRKKISEKLGNERSFLKEYPEDDISCFESGSDLVFPIELRKITCEQRKAIANHIHCIGVDVGGGGQYSDDTSITVIDSNTREQIYQESLIIDPAELPFYVYEIWKKYPGLVGIESNNDCGLTAIQSANKIPEWADYLFSNNGARGGFWTGHNKKPLIYSLRLELKQGLEGYPALKLSSEQIIKEMNHFQENEDGTLGSPQRTSENRNNINERITDDGIMSLMIAYGMLDYVYQIQDVFYDDFIKSNKFNI